MLNDMIGENVRELLLFLLKDEVIVASWGISNIYISEAKLSFSVCGFKYQGCITIEVKDCSHCEIFLGKVKLGCFTFDKVVSTIDKNVEYSHNYYQKIVKQLIKNET